MRKAPERLRPEGRPGGEAPAPAEDGLSPEEDSLGGLDDLFSEFSQPEAEGGEEIPVEELLDYISRRAALTDLSATPMPIYRLCSKLGFSPFTTFCFACAILSSTQTNYASVFQVVNQNGSLSAPTIESAGRVFYGDRFTITGAYGEMSLALEQLQPVLALKVNDAMPFSTVISPDKRMIDYLFSPNPNRIDENYASPAGGSWTPSSPTGRSWTPSTSPTTTGGTSSPSSGTRAPGGSSPSPTSVRSTASPAYR